MHATWLPGMTLSNKQLKILHLPPPLRKQKLFNTLKVCVEDVFIEEVLVVFQNKMSVNSYLNF
jgi:hypothetical protein